MVMDSSSLVVSGCMVSAFAELKMPSRAEATVMAAVLRKRRPPRCRWLEEIGGDSPAVIQGRDRDVALWSYLV